MKYLIGLTLIIISTFTHAGTSEAGIISELYVNDLGHIAVKLQGGFPNAEKECPEHNGWAGNSSADPALKSALLAAKTTGATVSLSIYGCDGGWLKVRGIYVR